MVHFSRNLLYQSKTRDALVEVIGQNKYYRVISILHSMTNGNLIPELTHQSNKINSVILAKY